MKVAVLTTDYPTEVDQLRGSFARYNAYALTSRHEVTVIHLVPPLFDDGENDFLDGDVRVRRYPTALRSLDELTNAYRIVESLSLGFDLLHSMTLSSVAIFGLNVEEELTISCPWVHSEAWTAAQPSSWPIDAAPPAQIFSRADVVTAANPGLAAQIEKFRPGQIVPVVPLIVPAPSSLPTRNVIDGRLRLATAGSIVSANQPELIVRTIRDLRKKGVDATLQWLGDGPFRGRAEARIDEYKLGDFVTLHGRATQEDFERVYCESDIFLSASKEAGFFLPCAQAIMCGLPVILGPSGDSIDYVRPEIAEIVSDKQVAASYVEAVERLVQRTAGMSAQDIVSTIGDQFTSEKVAQHFEAAYAQALAVGGWAS
ncbi:MAG: glycosyltransferase [Actinomycetaceae bacterium]|nr:glycosyltransferase [Actinomycetaceae bacterium]